MHEMPSLANEVADLASIVFNAYTSASPIWIQSPSVLILWPCRFRCNHLRCLYFSLTDVTSFVFSVYTSATLIWLQLSSLTLTLALPSWLQSYSALILRPRLFDFNRLRRLYFGLADFWTILTRTQWKIRVAWTLLANERLVDATAINTC
mgnify:CR=1 FL=1|jgi:hypothetical protein